MTATQVYEQAIKPLSADEKLVIARMIMDEVVPVPMPASPDGEEQGFEYLKRILPNIELITITNEDLARVVLREEPVPGTGSAGLLKSTKSLRD